MNLHINFGFLSNDMLLTCQSSLVQSYELMMNCIFLKAADVLWEPQYAARDI